MQRKPKLYAMGIVFIKSSTSVSLSILSRLLRKLNLKLDLEHLIALTPQLTNLIFVTSRY